MTSNTDETDLLASAAKDIVENSKRLGLVWILRPATVNVGSDSGGPVQATYDGDTVELTMTSLVGTLVDDDRVYALMVPPSGNYIIGFAALPNTITARLLRLTSASDASLTSTLHGLQIGPTSSQNLRLDVNEVLSVNNGAVSTLGLNVDGGDVTFQSGGAGTFVMRDDGDQSWSGTRRLWRGSRALSTNTNAGGPGLSLTDNPSLEVARDGLTAIFNNIATGASAQTTVSFRREGTQVGSISVTATTTAYNTSSDYRLKKNDKPLTGALERLKRLRPVRFLWRRTDVADEGFLAHEVQAIVPTAVQGDKDGVHGERVHDDDPETGEIIPQMLDYSRLVPVLCAALQELTAKVEALEAQMGGAR